MFKNETLQDQDPRTKALKGLRQGLTSLYGSINAASKALEIPQLYRYLIGKRPMPLTVFLDVVDTAGLSLGSLLDLAPPEGPRFAIFYLADVPVPKNPDLDLVRFTKLVPKVLTETPSGLTRIEDAEDLIDQCELVLRQPEYARVLLSEESNRLRLVFRSRRPGGNLTCTHKDISELCRFLLIKVYACISAGEIDNAAALMRLLIRFPIQRRTRSFHLFATHLLAILRRRRMSNLAHKLGSLFYVDVTESGDDSAIAYFMLVFAGLQLDLGKDPRATIDQCLTRAPGTAWAAIAVSPFLHLLTKTGKDETALKIVKGLKVPSDLSRVFIHIKSAEAEAYLNLGDFPASREAIYEALHCDPSRLRGFELLYLLTDLLRAKEDRRLVFAELRRLDPFLTTSDQTTHLRLRQISRLLEYELLREHGPRSEKLSHVREMCSV